MHYRSSANLSARDGDSYEGDIFWKLQNLVLCHSQRTSLLSISAHPVHSFHNTLVLAGDVVCFSNLVPNFIVGNSVISGVMGSFFLFSGYFISKHGIPSYWIFMHYISLFKYPFEGFLINEFSSNSGKCLEYMFGTCVVRGEDVLREEGFGEESRWRNVMVMVCFILVYRFISYVILRCRCSQRGLKDLIF